MLPLKLILYKDTNPLSNATNLYTSVRQIIFEFWGFFCLDMLPKINMISAVGPVFIAELS